MKQTAFDVPWRLLHVVNITTLVTGFCTFLPLSYVTLYFQQNCVLYAEVGIRLVNSSGIYVDTATSAWGDTTNCSYTTYLSVIATIHAFVWCWFVMFISSQKDRDRSATTMIPTYLLFHVVIMLLVFVSSCMVSSGTLTWCNNLTNELSKQANNSSCSDTQNQYWHWETQKTTKHAFFSFLLVAIVSSWVLTFLLLSQCILCGRTLYAWFTQKTNIDEKRKIAYDDGDILDNDIITKSIHSTSGRIQQNKSGANFYDNDVDIRDNL